ncbi:fluoride efflux transporter FluC [Paenibacillus chartarius]|uniref:Fluoride-specific ion channel FluC n=1 Tax=Paenibacillus chartarius TaxID=747481 RepID=A0ABV6DKL9_9BACL
MPYSLSRILAVGAGGIVGSIARFGLSLLWNPVTAQGFPWGTLACNLAGCLLLGYTASAVGARLPAAVQLGITAGLIGTFTTLSTFSLEMVQLLQAGHAGTAAAYAALSGIGGLALARLGEALGGYEK